ncbi:MAG TPA: hypothetical protein VIL86_12015 [Tepidisphaeraceae bacterium]
MTRILYLLFMPMVFCVSCVSAPPHPAPAAVPPGPATANLTGILDVSLTESEAEILRIPLRIRFQITAKLQATSVVESPPRSRYHADMMWAVKDETAKRTFLDFTSVLDGEADGTPNQVLTTAFSRLFDAFMFSTNPPHATTVPTTRP